MSANGYEDGGIPSILEIGAGSFDTNTVSITKGAEDVSARAHDNVAATLKVRSVPTQSVPVHNLCM